MVSPVGPGNAGRSGPIRKGPIRKGPIRKGPGGRTCTDRAPQQTATRQTGLLRRPACPRLPAAVVPARAKDQRYPRHASATSLAGEVFHRLGRPGGISNISSQTPSTHRPQRPHGQPDRPLEPLKKAFHSRAYRKKTATPVLHSLRHPAVTIARPEPTTARERGVPGCQRRGAARPC